MSIAKYRGLRTFNGVGDTQIKKFNTVFMDAVHEYDAF